jgi:hypothetical protein
VFIAEIDTPTLRPELLTSEFADTSVELPIWTDKRSYIFLDDRSRKVLWHTPQVRPEVRVACCAWHIGGDDQGPSAGLGSDRPGWPSPASTPTSESNRRRGKFGSRNVRAASLLGGGIKSGDHVRPTTSRGLNSGGWAARPVRGEGRER